MQRDLTKGSVLGVLVRFSLPYLLACFLQTFYGLVDLFVTGQFNGADAISAVSIGSQVMHMLTVIIVGLAMGATVSISRCVGEKDMKKAAQAVGNTAALFAGVAVALTIVLLLGVDAVLTWISVPAEAVFQTKIYLMICFAGIPFITAYNILSCIFRGMGDSKSPLYFVAAACALNIILDFVFVGELSMGAAGAALGTVISQTASVFLAAAAIRKKSFGLAVSRADFRIQKKVMKGILKIGLPISFQDGLIQISFMLITIIANRRGVTAAASVGIVEKIISFFFLVPSAMLSSISSITAQNVGAKKYHRGMETLRYGIVIAVSFGMAVAVMCQCFSPQILGMFTEDAEVIKMGSQYLRAYALDCAIAGVHFCFSGYFCAYGYSGISFFQNVVSIVLLRVPGAYLASKFYPDTLYPMGLAAPAGSFLSAVICVAVFVLWKKRFIPEESIM